VETLHVATLNIRNLVDRWDERLPLILADMRALQPDLLGLQEVVFVLQQDRLIGAAGEGRYDTRRGHAGRPEFGNSLLVREPLAVVGTDRLDLGEHRSALRSVIATRSGLRVVSVVTHLHHVPADEATRDRQVRALLDWLHDGPQGSTLVVVGDFNAEPDEPAARRMAGAGFRSAYAEANGEDPVLTWPSGLQGPAIDTDGDAGCLDYIWIRGSALALEARLVFDRPAVGDPGLFPSDHLGLAALLEISR
jgi:endonuclease/exonuclease/phosphatase family metal-dependent hydrolase